MGLFTKKEEASEVIEEKPLEVIVEGNVVGITSIQTQSSSGSYIAETYVILLHNGTTAAKRIHSEKIDGNQTVTFLEDIARLQYAKRKGYQVKLTCLPNKQDKLEIQKVEYQTKRQPQ